MFYSQFTYTTKQLAFDTLFMVDGPLTIPTENAEQEQWRLLSRLTFSANIEQIMKVNGHVGVSESTIEFISGCLRQSEAYFKTAQVASLDISPLLLYYGTTNLLAGVGAIMYGQKLPILGHGMKLELPSDKHLRIADVRVKPVNANNGGLQLFNNIFSEGSTLVNGEDWTFEEIVGSIPDARQDFLLCYLEAKPFSIPLQLVKTEQGLMDRIDPNDLTRFDPAYSALDQVIDLQKCYLPPQIGNQQKYIILRHRMNAKDICVYSLSGKRYLQISHKKAHQNIRASPMILMTMGLYILGYLSRYNPEIWNTFTRLDTTGEVLLIVKFLAICQRYIPNMVLDQLYGRRHLFMSQADEVLDLTSLSSMSELQKQIRDQLREELNKLGIYK
jgi:hypothetical protein